MPQSPNHGVSQIAIVYRSRTAWRTGPSRALAPIRHPTCVADVGSVVAARVQSAPLAAQLAEQIDKLTRDHQRAKNPEQRNEIFTKLHKAKNQLEELRKLEA